MNNGRLLLTPDPWKEAMLKCLALMQPWASLIVHAFKRYETRSWNPRHRGHLLIHASRRFNPAARNLATQQPFFACLQEAGYKSVNDLPIGAIVGIVNLVDVAPVEIVAPALDSTEHQFGDYTPGRYAWLLAGATPINPIQVGGGVRLVLHFPTRRAFARPRASRKTMLSYVLAGRKDLLVAACRRR
jgi:hypothetical protein